MRPVLLDENRFVRFYRGGQRIDAFRHRRPGAMDLPEDWVGSTTSAFGSTLGLTRLPDGRLLRDAIAHDPDGFLGREHVARYGPDPGLLVKLLDAGQRLPVHSHPGRPFAAAHLDMRFGKTEAWIILDAEPGAVVYLGPRRPLERAALADWIRHQTTDQMLGQLQEVPIHTGDALLVPAGTLHAIGEGILLLELQEPTDLSVLLEWRRFGVCDGAEHLHLGWPTALESVDLLPASVDRLRANRPPGPPDPVERVLPAEADAYFVAERIHLDGYSVELEASYSIVVAIDGKALLRTARGDRLELGSGTTGLVPYGAGRCTLEGHANLLRCLPPPPDGPDAPW